MGNVGIGITTTPLTNLDVYNSSGASQYIRTDSSALKFVGTGGANYIESGASTTADSKADLKFTSMNGTTPFVTIQGSTGNVGIGNISPAAKLDIVGGGAASVDLSVNGRFKTGDSNGAGGIWLYPASGSTQGAFIGNNGTDVGFWINNGIGFNAFSIVKSNGYVGINTTSPTTKLDVNGTIKIRGNTPVNGYCLTAVDSSGLAAWAPCPTGQAGATGARGAQGPQGDTGPQGPAAPNPN
jgi:hypothetical protein